ncbi:hypothetical protein M9H77_03298 [Catharanthus roseus]|uniref:Uncharacterized protein n=1 Tax=Catharanthus roseus TaxID=4058 RepID=A0ACC0CAW3_CATRO|nr:hypothetical protein M9H77_03298 [Catharanthus roseus]
MESLFYSYCVREEEMFQLVSNSFSYTSSLIKQALRIRYGVENHEGQGQGVAKVKFIEPSIVKQAPKVKEFLHATIEAKEVVDIHVEKKISSEDSCDNMNEKSIEKEEVSKEKENALEKSERVKENECFIEKLESVKQEQREKEIVVLEKREEVNFYANETNSFFTSESLYVQNFEDSSKV